MSSDSALKGCQDFITFITVSDLFVTTAFVIEFLLRAITSGFVLTPDAYLRNGWNRLDFLIVMVSLASLGFSSSSLSALRSLRVMRALRPLRLISRYPNLKLVVNSLIAAIPRVRNVAVVNFLFIFIFAVIGCQVCGTPVGGTWSSAQCS